MNNAGSPNNSLICPKCGLEQEERLDCKKCGVIFSKFFALYSSNGSPGSGDEEDLAAPGTADQDPRIAICDLQLQIRELNARFADMEFEKAERNQIRADLKILEQQLRENLEQTETRLDQCEQRIECSSLPKAQLESLNFNFSSIMERLERLEGKLENLESANAQNDDLWENDSDNSRLLLELHDQISALSAEVSGIKSQLDPGRRIPDSEEPRTALEDDVRAIRGNLDELRQFLGSLNAKH
jgi:chromosome segregation ATPase